MQYHLSQLVIPSVTLVSMQISAFQQYINSIFGNDYCIICISKYYYQGKYKFYV